MEVSEKEARFAKDEERVLAIPTSVFRELGVFQGFSTAMDEWKALATSDRLVFLRRGDAEHDSNYKQLIPYVLFTHTTQEGERSVFAYLRGPGQGEKRLVSKWSVGVGGHINDADAAAGDLFEAGTRREIAEEVILDAPIRAFQQVGLVNDDLSEVGRAHLGVVCVAELEAPRLLSREKNLLDARFRRVDELLQEISEAPERFETWTTLALQGLYGSGKE